MRIVYNSGVTGLVGTVGYRIVNADGTEYQPRTTVGITESPAGSYGADEPVAKLAGRTAEWDNGIGTVGASESFPASLAYAAPLDATATQTAAAAAIAAANLVTKGTGDKQVRLIVKNTTGVEIADAEVVVTTDAVGDAVVCGPVTTDALGQTPLLMLSAGAYYRWASKSGETFTNPQAFTVV